MLLVSAASAPAKPSTPTAGHPRGGTLRIDLSSDFDYIDPSLSYFSHSWGLQNATQLKLLSFPDKEGAAGRQVVPDAAAGLPKVSSDRKTYTFTIKRGFKFSDGSDVTAANFRAAFARALDPRMQSPAKPFLDDVASYRAPDAQTFVVRLKKPTPDFLSRMTMPFFSAIPTNRPVAPGGVGAPLVSAGPYYVRSWTKRRNAELVRNPFYPGPRDGQADTIVYNLNVSPSAQLSRCRSGATDVCTELPPAAYSRIAQEFGVNRSRFFVRKKLVSWYLALNNESRLFRNNPKLRRAVNHAIDRPQMVRQYGHLGGSRTDQILPPGMPGFRDGKIYSLGGENLTRARQLARGNTRGGKAVFYTFNAAPGPSIAQVVQFNLKQIGIDVEIKQFDRVAHEQRTGRHGERFDISLQSWDADYPDPYNFINVLLDGRRIQRTNNTNDSYFDTPAYNRKMERAAGLTGQARLRAYGNLDLEIMRKQAPLVPFATTNDRFFVSANVATFSYHPIYGLDLLGTSLVAPPVPQPPPPVPPPPPPPGPSCSQSLVASLTNYDGGGGVLPHLQVEGQCDAFVTAGWTQTEFTVAPKNIFGYRAHAPGPCAPGGGSPPTSMTCPVHSDGRMCTIIYVNPDAALNDSVRVRFLGPGGTQMLDSTLTLGSTRPACDPTP
jgi:ABC-type transport system substrate-binding protein